MGTRTGTGYSNASVGAIGELMFAAEARSRGHIVFFPVGEAVAGIDLVLVSRTGRKYTIQVKAQSTEYVKTVPLVVGARTAAGRGSHPRLVNADVVAVFNQGWYLVPRRVFSKKRKTLRVSEVKQHKGWVCIL